MKLPNKKIKKGSPTSQFINRNPKYQKMILSPQPIPVSGPKAVP